MRLLLVEDDVMLGKPTVEGLKLAGYAVDWFQNAEDAALALTSVSYDLILLDINLPGQSGLEWLKQLRGDQNLLPVLLLTAHDALKFKLEGFNVGADDYVVKPFDLDELVARAGALIRRAKGRGSPEIVCGDVVFNTQTRQVQKNETPVLLSGKELAILEILMNNKGRTISKQQIEDQIYDWNSIGIESNTVEVHISSIRRKLGKDLVKTMRGVGYMIAA
ncbi:MAG: response regulator transcription factor [Rhodospirillales bacterium]|nr:response regulator transcription factor [Alphaproteobacteria bacterium]MCB1840297.1 response regulator transcription factor [Alphaproteobacteria bacterium]MCB9976870.1 response regulator transcription factor [Rhodospirillales bacterium]